MGRNHVLIAVFVLAFVGCAKKQPVDKVTSFASDDPHMNAAIEKARSTVGPPYRPTSFLFHLDRIALGVSLGHTDS